MEFLETLETLRAEEVEVGRLFSEPGEHRTRTRRDPNWSYKVAKAAEFLADVLEGKRPAYHIRNALTTSDFPLLFGDILDRQVLAAYQEWPSIWTKIARRIVVNDFRGAKFYPPTWGADSRLDEVPERAEYQDARLNEQQPITVTVKKYGRIIPFSWEAIINDDLQQLRDIPERFGRAARRTESRLVVEQYVDANGPHASLYNATNRNIVNQANGASMNNPPLTLQGLQDAWKVLSAQKDENGEPIFLEMVTLVVPPALEVVARNILNATQVEIDATLGGGNPDVKRTDATPSATGAQRLITANWMRNNVQLVVDPYIPMVATSANGNSSWFLFADPNVGRPVIVIAFLRGHEMPEVWIKEPNARRVGGGPVDPLDGDFHTDSIMYRVRHVVGVARVDPKGTVASNGSGA